VPPGQAPALLAGDFSGMPGPDQLRAGPGWPHADTTHALRFIEQGGATWLIALDGTVIGEAGTKAPPDADGRVEIGYGLAPGSRGRGLGTGAVRALVAELWRQPGVRALDAEVAVDNVASRRLLERLGFQRVAGSSEFDRFELTPS
ncbi:MAG TPA: GNAT family N-acetyltransferase, partial [Mycobacteriales bacterium]|nr:GNAT family N-acetyltransferase [Mycobacteriales bacterium]